MNGTTKWIGLILWGVAGFTGSTGCTQPVQCTPPRQVIAGACVLPCIVDDVNYCSQAETGTDVVDATLPVDEGAVDVPPMCSGTTPNLCAGQCVNTQSSVDHCGACNNRCPGASSGTAVCMMGTCGLSCGMGQRAVGGVCVDENAAPRPIAPLSLGDVTLRRPTLRWELPAGFDGAVVELCSDRPCTRVIETIRATGTTARPMLDLPARSVVFWRMRGRVGMAESMAQSPTWLFHVPVRDASSGVDTSFHAHNDVNGDGYDDVAVGATGTDPGGRIDAGTVSIFHGGMTGLNLMPARVIEGAAAMDSLGQAVSSAGDVNGDGFGDVVILSNASAQVFHGSASGIAANPAGTLRSEIAGESPGSRIAGAGDINGDGFADFLVGAPVSFQMGGLGGGRTRLFLGTASGLSQAPAQVMNGGEMARSFGDSLASAGDLNGDGLGDIVIGAPTSQPMGRVTAGAAFIFHGNRVGFSVTPTTTLEGIMNGDKFGASITCAGDTNGDGYADVLIGTRGISTAQLWTGSMNGLAVGRVQTLTMDQNFGNYVAFGGDIDGDGFSDVIVGTPFTSTIRIFNGAAMGVSMIASSTLNATRCIGADVNGDGYNDLVTTLSAASPGGRMGAGLTTLWLGGAGGLPAMSSATIEGTNAGDAFGSSIAALFRRSSKRNRLLACARRI